MKDDGLACRRRADEQREECGLGKNAACVATGSRVCSVCAFLLFALVVCFSTLGYIFV